MRIAFDVKGTIEGPKKQYVIALLNLLRDQGHEVLVWSNSYGFAQDAVQDNDLGCKYQLKDALFDIHGDASRVVDLAIDDDSQQVWLASRRFIWVHDLPETMDGILSLAESVSTESWHNTTCQENNLLSRYL
jgi:hypothetical protein